MSEGRMPGAAMYENGGSKAGKILWVVTDDELEILPRNQVCRAAGETYARTNHTRNGTSLLSKACQKEGVGLAVTSIQRVLDEESRRASNEFWTKSLPIGGEKLSIREAKRNVR